MSLTRLAKPICVALLALSCGPLAHAEGMPSGLAVVDYDRLLLESAPGKQSIAPLDALMNQKKAEIKAMEAELGAIRAKAAEQATSATEKQLAAYQRQFNDKLEDLRRFQTEANNELDKLRAASLGSFNNLSLPVIQAMGKELGYSMIMQKQKVGLLYLDPRTDITDQVIQRLNTQAASGH
jgi:outer membrane protein